MENNETIIEETVPAVDPLEQLNQLKATMIDKAEYDRVVNERNNYFKALSENRQIETATPAEPVDVDALRKDIFTKDMTNLDYAKKVLQLRSELIARGEQDIFLGCGHDYVATRDDIDGANNVVEGLTHCIDVAEGDPAVFTREFNRILVGSSTIGR